ncbi:probable proteasome subunit alpha type-7 [Monosporozyma servazzii]
MTSIGTGYDLSNSVFSPDGRNFQVEYANKAVENGATSIGIRCQDGVVFAVEKLITSPLLVPGKNRKIQTVDSHIGCVYSGLIPDGRHLVSRGRDEAASFKKIYHKKIPVEAFADRLGQYMQAHTLYNSVRPFGISAIFGGVDDVKGPQLFMLEPNGAYWGYTGAATGKGRQSARAELEKLISKNTSEEGLIQLKARDAVKEIARIIYVAHEDNKEKDFEIEISWCSSEETQGKHKLVPQELFDEAVNYAKDALAHLEDSDDSDNDSDADSDNDNNNGAVQDNEGDIALEQ